MPSNKSHFQLSSRHLGYFLAALTIILLSLIVYFVNVMSDIYLFARFQKAIIAFYHDQKLPSAFETDSTLYYYPTAHKVKINQTLKLLSDIDKSHFDSAKKIIKEKLNIPDKMNKPILESIDTAIKLENELSGIKSTLATYEQAYQIHSADYLLIKQDLRKFLSLPDETINSDLELTENDFYNSSLLDSFPRISEYPDGIDDKQVIDSSLKKIQQAENPTEESSNLTIATKQFENLRTKSFELKNKLHQLVEDKKQLISTQTAKEQSLHQIVNTLRSYVLELISVRAYPKYPKCYLDLYQWLSRSFPSLPPIQESILEEINK